MAVWFMNGTTRRSSVMLTNTVSDLSWKIVAVADFNLDGYPDLLWRSDVTGDFGVWLMQVRPFWRRRCSTRQGSRIPRGRSSESPI